MDADLKEGEDVALPCRRCASLSIRTVVRKGTNLARCGKCGGEVWLQVTEGPLGGLQIRQSGVREPRLSGPGPRA